MHSSSPFFSLILTLCFILTLSLSLSLPMPLLSSSPLPLLSSLRQTLSYPSIPLVSESPFEVNIISPESEDSNDEDDIYSNQFYIDQENIEETSDDFNINTIGQEEEKENESTETMEILLHRLRLPSLSLSSPMTISLHITLGGEDENEVIKADHRDNNIINAASPSPSSSPAVPHAEPFVPPIFNDTKDKDKKPSSSSANSISTTPSNLPTEPTKHEDFAGKVFDNIDAGSKDLENLSSDSPKVKNEEHQVVEGQKMVFPGLEEIVKKIRARREELRKQHEEEGGVTKK